MKRFLGIALVIVVVVGVWLVYTNTREVAAGLPEGIATAPVQRASIDAVVSATGNLTPERSQALAFGASGRVAEVLVAEGQSVEAGQPLARLDTVDLELSLEQSKASLAVSEANLVRARQAPSEEELASAQAAVTAAEAALAGLRQGPSDIDRRLADLNVDQAKNSLYGAQGNRDAIAGNPAAGGGSLATAEAQVLNAELAVTIAELNREQLLRGADASAIRNAESQLAQARANLARLLGLPSEEDIRVAEAQLQQAQVNVSLAERRLADAVLVAPFAGEVGSLTVHAGDSVTPATPIATLVDTGAYHLEMSIDETEIGRIAVGQEAAVILDAYPDAPLTGAVSRIDLLGSNAQGIVNYTVTIGLGPTELDLKPLMTAAIDLVVERKEDVIVVPNRALLRDAQGRYVEVLKDGALARVDVTTGISNDTYTEVLSGLEPGQDVVVARPRDGLLSGVGLGGF